MPEWSNTELRLDQEKVIWTPSKLCDVILKWPLCDLKLFVTTDLIWKCKRTPQNISQPCVRAHVLSRPCVGQTSVWRHWCQSPMWWIDLFVTTRFVPGLARGYAQCSARSVLSPMISVWHHYCTAPVWWPDPVWNAHVLSAQCSNLLCVECQGGVKAYAGLNTP